MKKVEKRYIVSISNFSFIPNEILIDIGDSVTFRNDDLISHTATGDNREFNSGNLDPGDKFEIIFKKSGLIRYHCDYHKQMRGSVRIE